MMMSDLLADVRDLNCLINDSEHIYRPYGTTHLMYKNQRIGALQDLRKIKQVLEHLPTEVLETYHK